MTKPPRSSHHKYRLPDKTLKLAPTPDDEQILLEVYRHDIIDAKTIYSLLQPRSPDKISRRLNKLFKARYLHRFLQLEEIYVAGGGSRPIAYTLDDKGMALVTERFGFKPKRTRLRERAKGLSSSRILHDLELAQFIVSMRKSVDDRDDLHFLYPEDIYQHFAQQVLKRDRLPIGIRTRVRWFDYREEQGTNPDGFFMLYNPMAPEGKQRRSIFLEIDRGTETINPTDRTIKSLRFWQGTSILRKFVIYSYAFARNVHQTVFGIPTFQVLTVTTNRERVAEMQKMFRSRLSIKPHEVDNNRFLFTDWNTIRKHGSDLVTLPVENGVGEVKTLLI